MNRFNITGSFLVSLALLGVLLLMPLASPALAAADPTEQMRPFLNKVTTLLTQIPRLNVPPGRNSASA